jgi:DNA-binding transcriptional MerR regulator
MDISTTHLTGQKLPTRAVCARYGVSDRTIARWERDAGLKFPQALIINGRKYFSEDDLTAWDRANAVRLTAA